MSTNVTSIGPGVTYMRPELHDIKPIAVEEHVQFPQIFESLPESEEVAHVKRNLEGILQYPPLAYARGRGLEVGAQRLRDMDEGGIAMQILSFGSPLNTTFATAEEGLRLAQSINDELKKAVDKDPTRFRAFAELPFHAPELAIEELRRVAAMGFVGVMLSGSVGGTGKFLDDPAFCKLLHEFEILDMPLYLHPGIPPEPVVRTYYEIPGNNLATAMMASGGWGWHSEVGIHVLRLAISGTLDAHPRLKLVIGHQGEMLPFMLQRFDGALEHKALGLKRSVGEILRTQVWVALSGFFTLPVTQLTLQTWGSDHILFALDYPYVDCQRVPSFLKAMNDLFAPSDMRKILQTNAEELFKLRT